MSIYVIYYIRFFFTPIDWDFMSAEDVMAEGEWFELCCKG